MENTIINVDGFDKFILRTKNADYTLDINALIADYGVVRVLDSDGVRINDGDTVYGRRDSKAWHVTGVFCGYYPVWAVDDDGNTRELKAEWLTHEEPDSYEKIRKDSKLSPEDYCDKYKLNYQNAEKIKSKHIIGRCEKLAGVELSDFFDWDKFKSDSFKVAVHCKTKELAEDFLNAAEQHGCIVRDAIRGTQRMWGNKTCYRYDSIYGGMLFSSFDNYQAAGCKIVDWEN